MYGSADRIMPLSFMQRLQFQIRITLTVLSLLLKRILLLIQITVLITLIILIRMLMMLIPVLVGCLVPLPPVRFSRQVPPVRFHWFLVTRFLNGTFVFMNFHMFHILAKIGVLTIPNRSKTM